MIGEAGVSPKSGQNAENLDDFGSGNPRCWRSYTPISKTRVPEAHRKASADESVKLVIYSAKTEEIRDGEGKLVSKPCKSMISGKVTKGWE